MTIFVFPAFFPSHFWKRFLAFSFLQKKLLNVRKKTLSQHFSFLVFWMFQKKKKTLNQCSVFGLAHWSMLQKNWCSTRNFNFTFLYKQVPRTLWPTSLFFPEKEQGNLVFTHKGKVFSHETWFSPTREIILVCFCTEIRWSHVFCIPSQKSSSSTQFSFSKLSSRKCFFRQTRKKSDKSCTFVQ